MARILRPVYSFIVLISFVHYGSSSSITVTPNATTASPSPAATSGQAPSSIVPTPSSSVALSTTAGPLATKKFEARITVNETYQPQYSNTSSTEFTAFASDFGTKVGPFFRGRLSVFQRVEVKKLSNGSVVVDFDIVVQKSSNATVESIVKALVDGNGTAELGYTILGTPIVKAIQQSPASSAPAVPTPSSSVALSTTAGPLATKKFEARITVNETYQPQYSNTSSTEFTAFASDFGKKVGPFFSGRLIGFRRVEVKKLSNGSVVVDFDIEVQKSSNATVESIVKALVDGNGTAELGYTILGTPIVKASAPAVTPSKTAPVTKATPTTPTSSTKRTEIWDKAIDLATPMGTFIIVVVAVAVIIILLIALICVCCKYRTLKKKTHFPDHMAINDSEWIRSSDDLLMWERNLRASEVKTTNGVSNRPINDKRT